MAPVGVVNPLQGGVLNPSATSEAHAEASEQLGVNVGVDAADAAATSDKGLPGSESEKGLESM